ncbi:MAG: TonB-dependent receptor [Verrucomicrobiota bacterium]|nr:TonB-dependent receptor [Verrucomicrobiota bacterium]
MKNSILLSALLFLPFSILEVKSQDLLELSPTIVVATKTPKDILDVMPSTAYISNAELNSRQLNELENALQYLPGVSIVQTGHKGGVVSMFVRGLESNHVVTLLNGRRLAPGLAGLYNLELLDTSLLESVQLAKGPVSSLYGSDAIGGALDLRMTDARFINEKNNLGLITEAGSFNTFRNSIKYQTKEDNVGFVTDFAYLKTDNDRPFSEFKNLTIRNSISYEIAENIYFDILSYYQGSDLQVPGSELSSFFPESQLNVNESSLISPRFSILNDNWEAQIFYSRTESELEATQDVFLQDNLLEQTGNEIEALIHYTLKGDSKLSLGAGYYDYDFSRTPITPGPFNKPSQKRFGYGSIFFQADHKMSESYQLITGARWDEHDSFDSAGTYSVQISKAITNKAKLFGKISTGYKAPSGQDFVFLDPSVDPGLIDPEESFSWEVGTRHLFSDQKGSLSISYFNSDINNLVDSIGFPAFPSKVDTKAQGIEVGLDYQLFEGVKAYINYTWLDAVIDKGLYFGGFAGSPGDRLPRRPEHTASGGIVHDNEKWKIGAEVIGASNRLDSPGFVLEDYSTLRAYGSFKWRPNVEIHARVENVLDENFKSTRGYSAPGTGIYAGLKINF